MFKNITSKIIPVVGLIAGISAGAAGLTAIASADTGLALSGSTNAGMHFKFDGKFLGEDNDNDDNDNRGIKETDREANKPFLNGQVTAISGATLTVAAGNRVFTVDGSQAKVTGNAALLSGIKVGDMVFVKGSTTSSTTIKANLISVGRAPNAGMKKEHEARGTKGVVTAIATSTNSLTLRVEDNVLFTVNASTATVVKNGATTTLSSIQVGDKIVVQGSVSGTTITATTITAGRVEMDKDRDNRAVKRSTFLDFFINLFRRGEGRANR